MVSEEAFVGLLGYLYVGFREQEVGSFSKMAFRIDNRCTVKLTAVFFLRSPTSSKAWENQGMSHSGQPNLLPY